ncbi:hypothetical protein SeMB42_g02180 [Synchytrium endobioticum]|uniref:Uncharacterized protein n=1 Tax=Synchytrium endobioticum TaxID=286115 RepID=A0A507DGF0_9FUNG|nr:hypothetical protein SeLEV6574_g02839 [Synchytrium endobioticum]TPX50644.1 hypothetical protein SeMB42_g02180 [Synchytrium endobioticum]
MAAGPTGTEQKRYFEAELATIKRTLDNIKIQVGDMMSHSQKDLLSLLGDALIAPPDHYTTKIARELEVFELTCDQMQHSLLNMRALIVQQDTLQELNAAD